MKTINPTLLFAEHLWSLKIIIRTLPVHSLLNPLIDDRGGKMTAAHPWQGGKFHLLVYYSCTIYQWRARMGGHPCFMGQYAVINNN